MIILLFVAIKIDQPFMDRIYLHGVNRLEGLWNINLIPFKSIVMMITRIDEVWAIKNIIGNTVLFFPLGFLIPLAYDKFCTIKSVFLISFLFILGIEIFQFITMLGIFDIDDIFLNVSGSLIGYLIMLVYKKIFGEG